MSQQPFLGEICIFGFAFPPRDFALCNGQLLSIAQNQALFSLLGTFYGGDGITTFSLPDFRGRTPVHIGNGFTIGQLGGADTHSLTPNEMPTHNHIVFDSAQVKAKAGAVANQTSPVNNYFATNAAETKRFTAAPDTTMGTISGLKTISNGSSVPHENMQPYLVLNFSIGLRGIFPSRN